MRLEDRLGIRTDARKGCKRGQATNEDKSTRNTGALTDQRWRSRPRACSWPSQRGQISVLRPHLKTNQDLGACTQFYEIPGGHGSATAPHAAIANCLLDSVTERIPSALPRSIFWSRSKKKNINPHLSREISRHKLPRWKGHLPLYTSLLDWTQIPLHRSL
jgi:hypothetical protein